MKTKILLAGGSGLIGTRLTQYLDKDQYTFNILSRSQRENGENYNYFLWDTNKKTIDPTALEGVSVVINLAGAGIADKRWTKSRKKVIIESRVNSAATIQNYIDLIPKGATYIGASAVGLYGDQGEKKLIESDTAGNGFLADVTKEWEDAHNKLKSDFSRHILLRIGIVLSEKGGALKEMIKPSQVGMYGYFGNGNAYYSWVHIDDICEMIKCSIESNDYNGIYNATAPEPISIKALIQALKAAQSGTGLLMPIPSLGLKLALGQMAEMLTNSTRVIPQRLLEQNHNFLFTDAEEAIRDILARKI